MLDAYRYVMQHPVMVAEWITDHLCISLIAIAIGTVLGVTTGIFIAGKGRERTADIVLYFAEIMMTVPSLALFGLLMLLLSRMGLSAIGLLPAVITLVIYGQLPILRNTYTAIRQIDQTMIDAGRGMGMSESQLFLRIKLPLALTVIMAGLRNAMVLTIGIAACSPDWRRRAWSAYISRIKKCSNGFNHYRRNISQHPGFIDRWPYGSVGTLDYAQGIIRI